MGPLSSFRLGSKVNITLATVKMQSCRPTYLYDSKMYKDEILFQSASIHRPFPATCPIKNTIPTCG